MIDHHAVTLKSNKERQFYTYLHCKPNGEPFYVGKGSGKRSHYFGGRNSHHKNLVAKYGKENIGVFTFQCESESQANNDEIQQIAQLRCEGYELCNYTNGGEGASGRVFSHSLESREKIKAARVRQIFTPETRAKLSAAHKGRIVTDETREKLRIANIGRIMTNEDRAKMSISQTGKKATDKTKEKMAMTHRTLWAIRNQKKGMENNVES